MAGRVARGSVVSGWRAPAVAGTRNPARMMQMAMNGLKTRMDGIRAEKFSGLKMPDKVMRGKPESNWKNPAWPQPESISSFR